MRGSLIVVWVWVGLDEWVRMGYDQCKCAMMKYWVYFEEVMLWRFYLRCRSGRRLDGPF